MYCFLYITDFKLASEDVLEERVTLCIEETNLETITAFSISYVSNEDSTEKTQAASAEEITAQCIELYDGLKRKFTAEASLDGTISSTSYNMSASGTFCTSNVVTPFQFISKSTQKSSYAIKLKPFINWYGMGVMWRLF